MQTGDHVGPSWILYVQSTPAPTMFPFLSLPLELRIQIYRELRSFNSPLIESEGIALGYCSFGFQSRILEINRLISYEAKEVFYGENYWTFFVSISMPPVAFRILTMTLPMAFIRKAHIRFAMFEWIFLQIHYFNFGILCPSYARALIACVDMICHTLTDAPALRVVKLIWTETAALRWSFWANMTPDPCPASKLFRHVRGLIAEVLRPLVALQPTCDLERSHTVVSYMDGVRATAMETAFAECVDEVVQCTILCGSRRKSESSCGSDSS